nr:NUDIX domain-containing protein [Actinomyces sp.]
MGQEIIVSAVVIRDGDGRLLTVRKRGTQLFIFPGGKPEAGEDAAQTAAREAREELGIVIAPRTCSRWEPSALQRPTRRATRSSPTSSPTRTWLGRSRLTRSPSCGGRT